MSSFFTGLSTVARARHRSVSRPAHTPYVITAPRVAAGHGWQQATGVGWLQVSSRHYGWQQATGDSRPRVSAGYGCHQAAGNSRLWVSSRHYGWQQATGVSMIWMSAGFRPGCQQATGVRVSTGYGWQQALLMSSGYGCQQNTGVSLLSILPGYRLQVLVKHSVDQCFGFV